MKSKIFVSDKEEMRERIGFVCAAGFFILILISVSFLSFRDMNKRIISDIDSRLLVGAVTIKSLLPRDFHDQATGPGVISPEEDINNIDVLSEFANRVDFKFLYTLIKKNNQIYITSSSATQEELDNNEQVRYFTLFDEADPNFHKVFDGKTPVSFTHEDRWGTFRALALPETSPEGIKYLSVAEFDISYLKNVLKSKLIETVIISVLLVFGMLPLFYLFIRRVRRITEIQKKMEKQLQQAQKMESIGRLAGGVAHDYNNISSIIIGYSELALEKAGRDVSLHEDLLEIHKAAKRSTEITRQLLAFARKQTVAPTVLDVNVAVESMLKMLRRLIGEDIKLSWHPGEKIQPIKIDPSQIDQILANLCVNSRDAIKDVGKIDIETKNISFDEQYCASHAGFVPGDYVMISVSDDGSGIASEKMDEIFEPFFTTKGAGKGTGLGLATVYGIVKQNSGFINVYSESEKGATFKIYLPVHAGSLKPFLTKNETEMPLSRGEFVLLVEDDNSILKLCQKMLHDLGYHVLSSNSPVKALKLAQKQPEKIHLLITDVVMPEMNGRELSEQLQTCSFDLKTLFMSGYTANVIAHRGILDDGVNFISKPFSKNDLAIKIRETLDLDVDE